MKQIILSILCVPLFHGLCPAQQIQQEIDSLTTLLERHQAEDTTRLALLNDIAFAYYAVDPAKGLERAQEAIILAEKLHDTQGLAVAYSRKSTNHWARGEDSLAMDAGNRSLTLHKQSGNRLNYAKGLNNRALNHYNLGNYVMAIHDHEEALDIFKELNHKGGVQHSYLNMGTVFLALDDFPRALDVLLHAQKVDSSDGAMQAGVLSNIGLVYKNMKDYPQALRYQQEALEHYRQMGHRQGMANVLGNLATVYDLAGTPGKAIEYYERALRINKEIGNTRRVAADLTNIGTVYAGMGQAEKSTGYLQQAITLYQTTNDLNGLAMALIQLAETHGTTLTRKRALQEDALQIAKKSGSPLRESEALEVLSDTYEQMGKFSLALQAFREHIVLRDSIFNKEKEQAITRQQMEFDFEKREAVLKAEHERNQALARAEIRKQEAIKNVWLLTGGVLLLAIGVSLVFYKRKRDAVTQKQEAEFEAIVADTELRALRAQLNPHFIFNSLNSISDYVMKNDTESAQQYLTKFARLMRQALENSDRKAITLADDLAFVELYLQVEAKRLKNKFTYSVTVDEAIDVENTLVPPMLMQPLIENSIWHGVAKKAGKGYIHITFRKDGDTLICCVDDNGVGRTHSDTIRPPKRSFGIQLTEERLAILSRKRQIQGQLNIEDKADGGVCAVVRLPLQEAF